MTAPWMPPLPRAAIDEHNLQGGRLLYTADQMRRAQADAARAALEQLASAVADELERRKSIDVVGIVSIYENVIRALAKEIT